LTAASKLFEVVSESAVSMASPSSSTSTTSDTNIRILARKDEDMIATVFLRYFIKD
jgi:hypothetical protein